MKFRLSFLVVIALLAFSCSDDNTPAPDPGTPVVDDDDNDDDDDDDTPTGTTYSKAWEIDLKDELNSPSDGSYYHYVSAGMLPNNKLLIHGRVSSNSRFLELNWQTGIVESNVLARLNDVDVDMIFPRPSTSPLVSTLLDNQRTGAGTYNQDDHTAEYLTEFSARELVDSPVIGQLVTKQYIYFCGFNIALQSWYFTKMDLAGNILWQKTIDFGERWVNLYPDYIGGGGAGVMVANDDALWFVTSVKIDGQVTEQVFKLAGDGSTVVDKQVDAARLDPYRYPVYIQLNQAGEMFYLTDGMIRKFNADGSERWKINLSQISLNEMNSPRLLAMQDGGLLLSYRANDAKNTFIKIDASGIETWRKNIDVDIHLYVNRFIELPDGGFLITYSAGSRPVVTRYMPD